MKRKLLSIIALSITLLFFVAPASALPKANSPFSEQVTFTAPGNISQGNQFYQGSIFYVTNGISTGSVEDISGLDLSGTIWTKLSGFYDLTTGTGSFAGKWQITTSSGTFEGNVVGAITTTSPTTFHIHGMYVGFGGGSYLRDRIKGTFEGDAVAGTLAVNLVMNGVLNDKI